MAKLFPSKQTVVDHGDHKVIASTVKIVTSGDHLELPNAKDAGFLHATTATSDPTFYLTGGGASIAIDSATVGTEYLIVSRHGPGNTNFERGGNSSGSNNPN
jgi:hypothetical protein